MVLYGSPNLVALDHVVGTVDFYSELRIPLQFVVDNFAAVDTEIKFDSAPRGIIDIVVFKVAEISRHIDTHSVRTIVRCVGHFKPPDGYIICFDGETLRDHFSASLKCDRFIRLARSGYLNAFIVSSGHDGDGIAR